MSLCVSLAETGSGPSQGRLADVSFSAVYSSDLSRTVETAQIIVNGYGVSVQTDPDLREFSYGEWEGLTLEEVESQDSHGFAQRFNQSDVEFADSRRRKRNTASPASSPFLRRSRRPTGTARTKTCL